MPSWFGDAISSLTAERIGAFVAISIVVGVLSVAATSLVLVRIPADYFVAERQPLPLEGRSWWVRVLARALRNLAGLALVAIGIVLSLPGVPGPGLLTILIGVMLVDVPGKRRVERAIVSLRSVHRAIDRLRAQFGRAPLDLPAPPRSANPTR